MLDSAEDFISLTGISDVTVAKGWLEAANFDFEVAVNMYFSSTGGEMGGVIDDEVIDPHSGSNGLEGLSSSDQVSSMASTKSTDQRNKSYPPSQSLSDEVVRAPDAVRMAQLMQSSEPIHADAVTRSNRNTVSSVFAIGSGTFKAKNKKDATLEGLYGRPTELMYKGTFYELRQKGKEEDKWLLINVQAENVFNSHILNRDVWSDECIIDMVNCNFIFWQTQDFTEDGKVYAERYHVSTFPHIAILDPRTGGLVWSKEDIADKTIIAEHLQDFISDNPSPNSSRPNKSARNASLTEDNDVLSRPGNAALGQPSIGSGSASTAMNTLFGSEIVQTVIAGEISSSELKKQSDDVLYNFLNESHQIASSSVSSSSAGMSKETLLAGFEVRAFDIRRDTSSSDNKTARLMIRYPDGNKLERLYNPEDSVINLIEDVSSYLILDERNVGRRFEICYNYPALPLSTVIKEYTEKLRQEDNNKDKKNDELDITLKDLQLPGNLCEVRFL